MMNIESVGLFSILSFLVLGIGEIFLLYYILVLEKKLKEVKE